MAVLRVKQSQAAELTALLRQQRSEPTTIVLEPGQYGIGHAALIGSVTVVGEAGPRSTIVQADGDGELLKVTKAGSRISLRGLTLQGGASPAGGAVDATSETTITIEECILRNNSAQQLMGGAIAASGQVDLTVRRCLFVANKAERGGAIAVSRTAKARVDRCVFADNHAELGGAFFADRTADARITSCTFLNNVSGHPEGGGAIFVGGMPNAGPKAAVINSLLVGQRVIVNNPERPGEVRLTHCIVPPDALAQLTLRDDIHNLDIQPDLVEVAEGLWALRPGTTGSGTADLAHIADGALDLRGQPLVHDGSADPGALAPPRTTNEQVAAYTSLDG